MRSASDAVILLISDGLVAAGRVLGGFRRRSGWEQQADAVDALNALEDNQDGLEPGQLGGYPISSFVSGVADWPEPYVPLIAEKQCANCGKYRGQHVGEDYAPDFRMYCGTDPRMGVFDPLVGSSNFEKWTTQRSAAVTVPAADNTTDVDRLEAAWNYHTGAVGYASMRSGPGGVEWFCEGCSWSGPTKQAHARHRFQVLADMKNATTRVQEQLGGTA